MPRISFEAVLTKLRGSFEGIDLGGVVLVADGSADLELSGIHKSLGDLRAEVSGDPGDGNDGFGTSVITFLGTR